MTKYQGQNNCSAGLRDGNGTGTGATEIEEWEPGLDGSSISKVGHKQFRK